MPKLEQTKLIKRSIFWLAFLIMVVGSTYFYEKVVFQNNFDALPVSSSTKQLPIYCVETEKPQVALIFDAAWGMVKCASETFHLRIYTFYII